METVLTFQVRGKPRGKKAPRVTRFGTYFPADTVEYIAAVKFRAGEIWRGRPLLRGPVGAIVTAIFPVPKSWSMKDRNLALRHVLRPTVKPDWDNIGKMLDALKGVVWVDDSQVVDARVLKYYGTIPFLQVEIQI